MTNLIQPFRPVQLYKVNIAPTPEQQADLDTLLTNMFAQMPSNEWAMETGKSTGSHGLKLHWFDAMRWLVDSAGDHVVKYWEQLGYRQGANIDILASWANQHLENDFTGEHTHCGGAEQSHISAVYYFKKPGGSGNIEFVDPLEYINRMVPIHHYSEKDAYHEIHAKEYDLILFPSWIKHRTQRNKTDQERVAISMNYVGTWGY
jgi:uncharacterized protein (TIGR02466 family)